MIAQDSLQRFYKLAEKATGLSADELNSLGQNIEKTQVVGVGNKANTANSDKYNYPLVCKNCLVAPNILLRMPFFGISSTTKRAGVRVASSEYSGIRFQVTGPVLSQADFNVYLLLCAISENSIATFSAHSFLKLLGRQTGKTQHNQLNETLKKLVSVVVDVSVVKTKRQYVSTLVSNFEYDYESSNFASNKYIVKLDLSLFNYGTTTLAIDARVSLSKSLAAWLYGFYMSHTNPFDYKISTIKLLCGSSSSDKEFKRLLVESFPLLVPFGLVLTIKDFKIKLLKRT